MDDCKADLLVSSLPAGAQPPNPHVPGSTEHERWAHEVAEAFRRLDLANREVLSSNRTGHPKTILYSKGELEGRVPLRTASKAYVFGTSAVIDLEHIGMVLLRNVGPAPAHMQRSRRRNWLGRLLQRIVIA